MKVVTHTRGRLVLTLVALLVASPLFAQSATLSTGGGNAVVTGGDVDGWATLIALDYADGINQVELAHFTAWVDARQTVPLSIGFAQGPCTTVQVDVVWGVAPAGRYTMSDLNGAPVLASRLLPAVSPCRLPPDDPTPTPEPPCVSVTFNLGGAQAIARFPDGYPDPWLPTYRGPFYFAVPVGVYHVTSWTGDDHVGPNGKHDGPQHEIGWWWANTGQMFGPTNPIPEDANYVFSDLGVHALTAPISYFFLLHAATEPVTAPTDSFYALQLAFTCVAGSGV